MSSIVKALSLTGLAITISVLASLSFTIIIINNYTTNITAIITNIAQRINQLENQTAPTPTPAPTPEPIPCGTNNYNGTCLPTPNKEPVINVTSPVTCKINVDCILTAKIDDSDGNITQTIWNQESGKQVDFTSSLDHKTTPDTYTATFKPIVNDTYVFSIEAQDNNGSTTLKSITAKVGVISPPTPIPVPIPLPSHCEANEHLVNNICVPNPPPPTPTPTSRAFTFTVVADIESGTAGNAVYNQIKKQNANYDFVLGDLGYASDLKWFKSTYGTLGDKMYCVVGNHESANEDGTSSIQKETQEYCGDSYWIKEGSTLFMLFNTNGDLNTEASIAGKILQNSTFMNGVKTLHILSHKPCAVPPNSHHGLEIKSFCDSIKSKIPSNVKVFYTSGHNHVMSASADGQYKQVGSGGKSHYTCGTSTTFPFCDNTHFGFLKYTVKADGTTTWKFIDYNGSEVTGIK